MSFLVVSFKSLEDNSQDVKKYLFLLREEFCFEIDEFLYFIFSVNDNWQLQSNRKVQTSTMVHNMHMIDTNIFM